MRRIRALYSGWRSRLIREEDGQAATEYMLVISVMVIAMIMAATPFVDPTGPFQSTMERLSKQIGTILASDRSPLLPGN